MRTARTRQEDNETERAEHAYYSHMHDEVTISDSFTVTGQGLDEKGKPHRNTIPEDDQEDATEQSLTDSLQVRRQMGHPSNRTLVRVLRLGGAKRRFILAAAKHNCGACEAQKRPAGPIVNRSPHSFVFNEVVGLDLFFLNTYEKHTLPAMNIVCWGTGLQRGTHTETFGYGRMEGLASLLLTISAACVQGLLRRKLKAMGPDLK